MVVKERLRSLDLKYLPPDLKRPGTLARYHIIGNFIEIFINNENEELFTNVYPHEMIHAFTPPINFGRGIDESLTEILACEFFKGTTREFTYADMCGINKVLFEIIGGEPFLRFKFSGNKDYLINALKEIISDENKAYQLIANIDSLFLANHYDKNISKAEIKEAIYNSLKDYYSAKYSQNIEEDLLVMAYLSHAELIDNETDLNLNGIDYPILEVNKPYFSSNLKNSNPNGYFIVESNDIKEQIVSINLPYGEAMSIISAFTKDKNLYKVYLTKVLNSKGEIIIVEARIKCGYKKIPITDDIRYTETIENKNSF